MRKLLTSPRTRRRAFWIAVPLLVAGFVAGAVSLIPNTTPQSPAVKGDEGPAQAVVQNNARLTAADRREIDAVLAKFVPAAVGRRNLAQAWALAGPELKASTSLADWKKGNSPVPYFPVREKTFTGWPTVDVEKDQVTFSLLVHPQPGKNLGDYTFSVEAIRQRNHWLINRIYTIAINKPARNGQHEVGPADFSAPSGGSSEPAPTTRLGGTWLIPIVGILSSVVVIPLILGIVLLVRSRRRKRLLVAEGRTELPPLPSSFKPK